MLSKSDVRTIPYRGGHHTIFTPHESCSATQSAGADPDFYLKSAILAIEICDMKQKLDSLRGELDGLTAELQDLVGPRCRY